MGLLCSREQSTHCTECWEIADAQWHNILRSEAWSSGTCWHSHSFHRFIRGGVPDQFRSEVFIRFCDFSCSAEKTDTYRTVFLAQPETNDHNCLECDVECITKDAPRLCAAPLRSSFVRVLCTISPLISYTPRFGCLVAVLLGRYSEEDVYILMRMLQGRIRDEDDAQHQCMQLEHLMERHLPKLHRRLREEGFEAVTFACIWFLSWSSGSRLPLRLREQIGEWWIVAGNDSDTVLFSVALSILAAIEKRLLTKELNSAMFMSENISLFSEIFTSEDVSSINAEVLFCQADRFASLLRHERALGSQGTTK